MTITTHPSPVAEATLTARAFLMRLFEPPAPTPVVDLVVRYGAATAVDMISTGSVPDAAAAAVDAALRNRALPTAAEVAHDRDLAAAAGLQLLVPEDPAWPIRVDDLGCDGADRNSWLGAPLGLWVRGDVAALGALTVAVIGARAATAYGLGVADMLASGLARHDYTVVNGAALGVDGIAMRAALHRGVGPVAVLPCGANLAYPTSHRALIEQVGEVGVVVSEYPPGTRPARYRFLVRNRLVAALGVATVVVEAGVRSGTMQAAMVAQRLRRPVMAVPGGIVDGARSAGPHQLIRSGAVLVTSVEEVLEGLAAPPPTRTC